MIANGFGAFQMWQSADALAQQTVTVYPGQNLQAIVNQYPAGTTFSFTPGIYYYQSIVPQSYDSFVGQPGAILSGATLLQTFAQSGSYWTSQVQVAQTYDPGVCGPNPACTLDQDLFFNNVLQTRVTSLSAVGPGTWYLDYGSGTVYMGSDPSSSTVELSVLPHAFTGTATSVNISNLTIEKYASVAGSGAVDAAGTYWQIYNNRVRFNHGMGIQTGDGSYIYNNYIRRNGELGLGGQGNNVTVQSNEIAWNNYAGYTIYNEAGGAKFTNASNVTFRYNYVHDNWGPGFWTDLNVQGILCDSNQFSSNEIGGVFLEISNNATVSNNTITNDGNNPDGTGIWWGAGILISDSTNVSVYFNTVTNSMNGIAGLLSSRGNAPNGQPYTLQNIDVNSNWVTQNTGIAAGIAIEGTGFDNSVYTSWNNQFWYNTFYLSNPSGDYFYWMGGPITLAQFDSYI
jgi:parallel beta-helix repeat protein